MSQQVINIGTGPDSGDGDLNREAWSKAKDNFAELYKGFGGAQGSDVASASTVNLDAATGFVVNITGTTTITAMTLANGQVRMVRFGGALTLQHGANLKLPYGANVLASAGAWGLFVGIDGGAECIMFLGGTLQLGKSGAASPFYGCLWSRITSGIGFKSDATTGLCFNSELTGNGTGWFVESVGGGTGIDFTDDTAGSGGTFARITNSGTTSASRVFDMIVTAAVLVQRISGVDGTFTFDGKFVQNYLRLQNSTLDYASGSPVINFNANSLQTVTLAGDPTFSTSNRAADRSKTIRIIPGASSRNLTWPSGWHWLGAAAPSTIAANKEAILTLTCFGTADSDIHAAYAVEP